MPAILLSLSLICCSGRNSTSLKQTSGSDSSKSLTYEERQGRQLYKKYCAVCHGEEGKGDGFNAFNLDPKPRNFTDSIYMSALSDERIVETISQGGRGVNRSMLMPTWGGRLKREEIKYVVSYIRRFSYSE
ncbi:MAG: cytochrome c [Ignavibacteriae bacterium]|nr:cytochrome c [Ignavibacteriota bacterium]